jgi:hypothetical protein
MEADPARTAGDVFTANSSWMPRDFGAFKTMGEGLFYRLRRP